LRDCTPDDLTRFGLIPELIGRFTNVVALEELTVDQLIEVLTKVKNNLVDQYKYLFSLDGMALTITEDAVERIATKTVDLKTGARGLHTELERSLLPHMYNLRRYKEQGIEEVVIDSKQIDEPKILGKEEDVD